MSSFAAWCGASLARARARELPLFVVAVVVVAAVAGNRGCCAAVGSDRSDPRCTSNERDEREREREKKGKGRKGKREKEKERSERRETGQKCISINFLTAGRDSRLLRVARYAKVKTFEVSPA